MVDDVSKQKDADAYDLFPDLLGEATDSKQKKSAPVVDKPPVFLEAEKIIPKNVPPPEPPDLNWLKSGELRSKSRNIDDPTALLLVMDDVVKKTAGEAFSNMGYQVEDVVSEEQAIIKMNSGRFTAVILHEDFVSSGLEKSEFHKFMKSMGMVTRRPVFYVLIGSRFHTLYDLEALCESVNVVVNTADTRFLNIIIHKGLKDYEKLFGSFIKANRRQ